MYVYVDVYEYIYIYIIYIEGKKEIVKYEIIFELVCIVSFVFILILNIYLMVFGVIVLEISFRLGFRRFEF